MPKVTIDGVDYYPQSNDNPSIGVAVTTYNRPQVLAKTLEKIKEHTPGAYTVVIDDASPTPAVVPEGVDLIRLAENSGIAKTKNKSILKKNYLYKIRH